MNLNQNRIKNQAANPAIFSRAQSFYNSGGKITYYVTYDATDFYQIFAEVEDDNETYQIVIQLDEKSKIVHDQCDCGTFLSNFGSCKHVIATLLKVYDDQIRNKLVIHSSGDESQQLIEDLFTAYESKLTSEILNPMDSKNIMLYPKIVVKGMEETSLEVSIGMNRSYVVKDIYKLASDFLNENVVSYGKELQFKHSLKHFDERSRPLVSFIEALVQEYDLLAKQLPMNTPIKSTRSLILTPVWFDKFYKLYERQSISCEIEDLCCDLITLHPYEPNIEFRLEQQEEDYYLTHNLGPFRLIKGQHYHYILCEREAYRCESTFIKQLFPILKILMQSPHYELRMNEAYMGKFLSLVMPKIKDYIHDVSLNEL
ncbi:MAG: SNF2 helicase associated domain-containing protein, partial [Turicibacter sp.]|nr:SNF2 helicase associated domain-containing protein [Turicibacter sp.]